MEEAGQKLKRIRERLGLTYRDVEDASTRIAEANQNQEFVVALSRLADMENKGTMPSIYRLYSLCAIYRKDLDEMLAWYGISLAQLPADSRLVKPPKTHMVGFTARDDSDVQAPMSLDPGIDLSKTEFLSRLVQRWGRLPLALLSRADLRSHSYGLIGTDDWFMYPIVPPGSLVVIDDTRRRVATGGWNSEFDRPIYFLEHRDGYACAWCTLREDRLALQPHPASRCEPLFYKYQKEIEIIGQVTEIAMSIDPGKRRRPST